MASQYAPKSHFFAEYKQLLNADPSNAISDTFGPIDSNKYRLTSKVRTSSLTKLYAVCDGEILIQPQMGDDSKLNFILKPAKSYAPLKIKYFIYRGINKSDWFDINNNFQPTIVGDINQPTLLQEAWRTFTELQKNADGTTPSIFPASSMGYEPVKQSKDSLIDSFFKYDTGATVPGSQQPLPCKAGDYIGNFSNILGLDIVLDFGDYKIENQEILFNLDLSYARSNDAILDVTSIPSVSDPTGAITRARLKKFKEYIHQFIDAAAFWGSHIDQGVIELNDNGSIIKSTKAIIVNDILSKFQTGTKIYVYIRDESGRSYNYYDSIRKIEGFGSIPEFNNTDQTHLQGWPILIKELLAGPSDNKIIVPVVLQYEIDDNVHSSDASITIDLQSPNQSSNNYPVIQKVKGSRGTPTSGTSSQFSTAPILIDFEISNSKVSCSTFCIITAILKQKVQPYYNDLWPATTNAPFAIPSGSNDLIYWSTYDNNRLVNLNDISQLSSSIQNKLIIDIGSNISNTAQPTMKRRLYLAVIKANTDMEHMAKLNVSKFHAGISPGKLSKKKYWSTIYGEETTTVFKGQFKDKGNVVNSLSVKEDNDFDKKNSYFHLGITDDEYQKLLYDKVPPIGSALPILPPYADKVKFHLEEDKAYSSGPFKKFKLGLMYEDNLGQMITTPIFPSSKNTVYIYTIDGLYFFSAAYSEYQTNFEVFSECSVNFRPQSHNTSSGTVWKGGYGFDWVRVNDTNLAGDVSGNEYIANLGHYYSSQPSAPPFKAYRNGSFTAENTELMKFRNQFPMYASNRDDLAYSAGSLALYPSVNQNGTRTQFPKTTTSGLLKCLVEAQLDIIINIKTSPTSLILKYETDFLEVNAVNPTDLSSVVTNGKYCTIEIVDKSRTGSSGRRVAIKVKALKEFPQSKFVQVIADNNIAGELEVVANAKQFRKEIKVALVSLITQTGRNNIKVDPLLVRSETVKQITNSLNMIFNQIHIDVVDIQKLNLDVSKSITLPSGKVFDFNATYVKNLGTTNAAFDSNSYPGIHPLLEEAISLNPIFNQLKDYFFIFYIGLIGSSVDSNGMVTYLNGVSEGKGTRNVCVFQTGIYDTAFPKDINDTSAHELLHSCGLDHVFVNDNPYTFQEFTTDNVMDYTKTGNASNRFTLSKYQKRNIEKHYLIKPE